MNRLIGLLALCLLIAWSHQAMSPARSYPEVAVFGGKPVADTDRLAHYLAAVWATDEEGQQEICTGISIQPQVILTAGHCAYHDKSGMRVVFSPDAGDPDPDRSRAVVAVKLPTHFDAGTAKATPGFFYDVALLRLDRPAPDGTLQMQLPDAGVDVATLQKVEVAGYGASSFDGDTGVAGGLDEHLHWTVEPTRTAFYDGVLAVDQTTGTGVCVGDSGGPAFAPSGRGYVVLGTLIDLDRSTGEACRGIANFTDLTKWIDWIQGNSFVLTQNVN